MLNSVIWIDHSLEHYNISNCSNYSFPVRSFEILVMFFVPSLLQNGGNYYYFNTFLRALSINFCVRHKERKNLISLKFKTSKNLICHPKCSIFYWNACRKTWQEHLHCTFFTKYLKLSTNYDQMRVILNTLNMRARE